MPDQFAQIRDLFLEALDRDGLEPQLAFAAERCGDSPELRTELAKMLRAHHDSDGFLESQGERTRDMQVAAKPGETIGRYKLREQIGEGGFGVVYVAEQEQPLRRKVAIKIIKPGMDSREIIARFEAERQALALMDHTNVAKVLDAGTTDSGRPYFVMELIRGVPITKFCDQQKLNTTLRLRLLVDVCRAVQHAHQKGIIHRDIKPSNVMVTMRDDKPTVKVIDFGVAKAVSQRLTEKTIYTAYGQMVGTPMYMSPEQAQMNEFDADTRSDVYSLGVLLYELLTGVLPFEREKFKQLAFDELRRMIREDEPPPPSTRFSTLKGKLLSTVTDQRQADARRLFQELRGDLDWIVMKALEKDRNRRYESASAFAADIERYDNDEPVEACPPSIGYRVNKFVRRNKGRVAVATTFLVVASIVVVISLVLRTRFERQHAEFASSVRQSTAETRVAIKAGDLTLAFRSLAAGEGSLAGIRGKEPQLVQNFQELRKELEDRQRDSDQYDEFITDTQRAQKNMSYIRELEGDKTALAALARYGILEQDDWRSNLRGRFLTDEQKSQVEESAYRTLLCLGDFGVRWYRFRTRETAEKSLFYLKKAATFHEPTRAFYWIRSECHAYLGNSSEAAADHNRYVNEQARCAFDYFLPGHTAGWKGDLEEAVRAYKAALRIEPDHATSLEFLASRLRSLGRPEEAIEIVQRMLVKNVVAKRQTAWCRITLAEFSIGIDQEQEALDFLARIHESELNSDDYLWRATLYWQMKKYEEAVQDCDRAFQFSPTLEPQFLPNLRDLKPWLNSLAWSFANAPIPEYRDAPRVLRLAKRAVELETEEGKQFSEYLNTLGVAEYRVGNWLAAVEKLEKVAELNNGQCEKGGGFFLAMAHHQLGQKEEAVKWLEKSVKWMKDNHSDNEELIRFRSEAEELIGSIDPTTDNHPPLPEAIPVPD